MYCTPISGQCEQFSIREGTLARAAGGEFFTAMIFPPCRGSREAGFYQRLFRTADIRDVNSEYTRGRVEQLGCPFAKLHKLPMGLNLDDFVFRERTLKAGEPVRIMTVARLVEIKGPQGAIRAVARLRERHAGLRYEHRRRRAASPSNWSNW